MTSTRLLCAVITMADLFSSWSGANCIVSWGIGCS